MGRPTDLTSSVSFGGLEEGGEEDKVYEKHWERKQIKLNLTANQCQYEYCAFIVQNIYVELTCVLLVVTFFPPLAFTVNSLPLLGNKKNNRCFIYMCVRNATIFWQIFNANNQYAC